MNCAPVCIITLNRYEHLQKCLDSLSNCTLSEYTDVYVAIDFPPSDKYVDGWKKNIEFLDNYKNHRFKSLNIIKREVNYGIWNNPSNKPTNLKSLIQSVLKKYDRCIFSEDDNIFAPCFLDYMNKGLELFKDDANVYSIGGYRFYYPIKYDTNNFIRQDVDYSPWGVGLWKDKIINSNIVNYKWFRRRLTLKKIISIKNTYGWGAICGMLSCSSKNDIKHLIDRHYWSYMNITSKQQIIPTQTLVKNIGLDGSGETMKDASGQEWCDDNLNPLSTEITFEFKGTGYEFFNENRKIFIKGKYWQSNKMYMYKSVRKYVKFLINI